MPIRSGGKAPYAPPAAVLDVINGFRDRGLATPFTNEVLVRAGVSESLAPRTLRALVDLDLIDGNGSPTESFEGLRRARGEEYPMRLEEVIRSAYAEVFQFADPSTDNRERVEDAFRAYDPAGQRGRMVTLFLGLCEAAGIDVKAATSSSTARGNGVGSARSSSDAAGRSRGKERTTRSSGRGNAGSNDPPPPSPPPPPPGIPVAITGLLTALPSDGAGWARSDRDKFIETFGHVLDLVIPVTEDE